jgi:hypothetical protein
MAAIDAGVVALFIPIAAILSGAAVSVARIMTPRNRPVHDDLAAKVDALADDLASVRQELAETHERLDFTERLLAAGRESPPAPPTPSA